MTRLIPPLAKMARATVTNPSSELVEQQAAMWSSAGSRGLIIPP